MSLVHFAEMCKEECKFNGVCQVEHLGVHCSCEPIQCDGTYKPLCGKDGRSYVNDCERRRAECLAKAHIPVKQQGPCGESGPLGGGGGKGEKPLVFLSLSPSGWLLQPCV